MRWTVTAPADCRDTLRCLQSYLDEECEQDRIWSVARHLAKCRDCFQDAEMYRQLKAAVSDLRCAPDAAAMQRLRGLVASLEAR